MALDCPREPSKLSRVLQEQRDADIKRLAQMTEATTPDQPLKIDLKGKKLTFKNLKEMLKNQAHTEN